MKKVVKYDTNGPYIEIEDSKYYINLLNPLIKLETEEKYIIKEIITEPINTYVVLEKLDDGNNE